MAISSLLFGLRLYFAWHLAHRIRETWEDNHELFAGPVEADQTYMDGLEKNKHADKKLRRGGGSTGKTPVAGVRDQATGHVEAAVVPATDKAAIHPFVIVHTEPGAVLYTDEPNVYRGLPFEHHPVYHGAGVYVD